MQEIYYWLVCYLKKVTTNDTPEFNSFLLLLMMLYFNIMSIWVIVKYSISSNYQIADIFAVIIGILIGVIIYFSIFRKRKEFHEKYEKKSCQRKKIGKVIFWFYAIFSFLFFFVICSILGIGKW